MAFKCPNCGGNKVHYDVENKMLNCEHCGESWPADANYEAQGGPDAAEEHKYGVVENGQAMQVISYVCKSCGAELLSPEESIVSYCSYCGSESLLEGRMVDEVRPTFIMPFQRSKKECVDRYARHTKNMLYLPDDLKNPEYLEKFRGTYIPYWLYKVDFPEVTELRAVTRHVRGDQVTETTYDVSAKIEGNYQGIPYDASSCFDDTISDMLMPFDKKKLIKFAPSFLAGFYADRADVPPERYVEEVNRRAAINAYDSVASNLHAKHDMDLDEVSEKRKANTIPTRVTDYTTALLPVWFLTWRNKNRVAYAIVNGQSGKLSADLPVDMKKFALGTFATAIVLFALMTLLVSLTAKTALAICTFLTLVVMGFMNSEVKKIRDRENHIFDKGYFVKGRQVKMPEHKVEKTRVKQIKRGGDSAEKRSLIQSIGIWVLIGFAFLILLTAFNENFHLSSLLLGIVSIYLIIGVIIAASSRKALIYVRERSIRLFNLLSLLAIGVAFAVALMNPPEDYYYYIASAICGLGAAVSAVGLIKYYNLLTTRPIPSFFDREGGNDDAE